MRSETRKKKSYIDALRGAVKVVLKRRLRFSDLLFHGMPSPETAARSGGHLRKNDAKHRSNGGTKGVL